MRVLYDSWEGYLKDSGRPEGNPAVMPWLFSKSFRQLRPESVKEIKARLTKGYLPRTSEAFSRQVRANVAHDTRGRLGGIQARALILVGSEDELTPPRMAQELASEMPNAHVRIFEGGGHGLYWEIPALFNQAVIEFLTGQA